MISIDKFELIVNEENRNKFGEVFTNIDLISEMLENVDTWSDPTKTYYDPTCGYGYFLFFVYDILMGNGFKYNGYEEVKGLKYVITDENDRERHIIENMLFGTDIQQGSVDKCNELFRGDIYKTNFICAEFMLYETDTKFDNIIGNPPFEDYSNGKRKAKNHNLWRPIIMKSFTMLKDNGNMIFVCPQSWMSYSKTNADMFSLFNSNDVLKLNIGECKKYFKGVGSSFSYFFIRKSKIGIKTDVVCEYKNKNYNSLITIDNLKFLPLLITDKSISILEKCLNIRNFDLKFDSYLHAFTKKTHLSKVRSDEFCYKVWHTPNSILWSKTIHPTQNNPKLLIPISTYYEKMLVDISGNTQGMGYILCESVEEAESLKRILLLKLYRFIVNITRWSNWNSPDILRRLPFVDITIDWTDEMIYDHFNLTKDEIDIIEKVIAD